MRGGHKRGTDDGSLPIAAALAAFAIACSLLASLCFSINCLIFSSLHCLNITQLLLYCIDFKIKTRTIRSAAGVNTNSSRLRTLIYRACCCCCPPAFAAGICCWIAYALRNALEGTFGIPRTLGAK